MTIHSEHPFVPPEPERDPLRRFRGRLAQPVTVVTAGRGDDRVGLTVSSVLVAEGDPARVALLVDEDSDLAETLRPGEAFVVNVLGWAQRGLADPFAGTGPAPGGPFRLGEWSESDWGPVLVGSVGWLGARVTGEPRPLGWPLLVDAAVEQVTVSDDDPAPLTHLRGRYRRAD
ncbi:flavin reductase (DIM6/NTAB) family NADH-FMN oxidoreductase RutF [Mumia flava]|uniref:Flavin reductase (DIM6/NTAB) family NADH-FMN oxidoreductase RutF n=1 Tax=Mumia flava TaxID=1348852 RepID=A0A2M9B6U2_9ACTN|nr:flavin reductase family protein [Mumia flava]PJJ53642.1 flavin reductase (DIM6/NTAB) family NADH-FMN oxidoreductase RutF [Mumia flava]